MMHPRHHLSLAAAAAVWLLALLCLLLPQSSHGFLPTTFTATTSSSTRTAEKIRVSPPPNRQRRIPSSSSLVIVQMGFLDNIKNAFLQDREGDFIKLDADDQQAYGPGPLLVLYNCPAGITKNEIMDMLEDGAPLAFAKGITLFRCNNDNNNTVLDKSVQEALEGMAREAWPTITRILVSRLLTRPFPYKWAECPPRSKNNPQPQNNNPLS